MLENTLMPIDPVLRHAFEVTSEGITIADARKPDCPLIYLNRGFEKMTGYRREDVMGKNCRFLQGPDTSEAAVAHVRQAIKAHGSCVVTLLNYRKNGERFWNRLSLVPIFGEEDTAEFFVGIQADLTSERRALQHSERKLAFHESIRQFQGSIFSFFTRLSFLREEMASFKGVPEQFLKEFDQVYEEALGEVKSVAELLRQSV